jgi:hypothetical protein
MSAGQPEVCGGSATPAEWLTLRTIPRRRVIGEDVRATRRRVVGLVEKLDSVMDTSRFSKVAAVMQTSGGDPVIRQTSGRRHAGR